VFNRFGCTLEQVLKFKKLEEDVKKPNLHRETIEEKPEEEEEEEESKREDSIHNASLNLSVEEDELLKQQELIQKKDKLLALKNKLTTAIRKKEKVRFLSSLQIILKNLCLLLLVISAVFKSNIFSVLYVAMAGLYVFSPSLRVFTTIYFGLCLLFIQQYALSLLNLTSENNPMPFPTPFEKYPDYSKPPSDQPFPIPFYRFIPFMEADLNWALYFGMGISN